MHLDSHLPIFPWTRYSKKLNEKIDKPRCCGQFTKENADARGVFFAEGAAGSLEDGNWVHLYWLVDREDGVIIDVKFQAFAQSALIGAAEIASEFLIGKNYDQASRISTTVLDQQARERRDLPAFPPETVPHLQLVIDAVVEAALKCTGIPLASSYSAPPVSEQLVQANMEGDPNWLQLSLEQQLARIDTVLNEEVRPYIALDGGGIEVISLLQGKELKIAYQGSCTSCYSSIGTTLSYIQQTLRARLHPQLTVIPDFPT